MLAKVPGYVLRDSIAVTWCAVRNSFQSCRLRAAAWALSARPLLHLLLGPMGLALRGPEAASHLLDSASRAGLHAMATEHATDRAAESFQGLLLRHRGRTGLTQRELAARVGVSRGSVQDWEAGLNYPDAEHLQALIAAFLQAGGLTAGSEAGEAEALWAAALRQAPRMQTPFDGVWWDGL